MARPAYPTDLTEARWRRLAPLSPPAKPGGRRRSVDIREVLNARFSHLRGGASRRMLPHDLPPWGTVPYYYRRWRLDGTWPRIEAALPRQGRRAAGRAPEPSAGLIDSQSVKTTGTGGRAAMTPASR
jgi:putative transposase